MNGTLEAALRDGRVEDALAHLRFEPQLDPVRLFEAALKLRRLFAYAVVEELCARVAAQAGTNRTLRIRAREQQALAIARQSPARAREAKELLARADEEARGVGEARALRSRIAKEQWRAGWFQATTGAPVPEVVKRNLAAATSEAEALDTAIRDYAFDPSPSYYPPLNALTLARLRYEVAQQKDGRFRLPPDHAILVREVIRKINDRLVDEPVVARDREEKYWQAASRAEYELVRPAPGEPVDRKAATAWLKRALAIGRDLPFCLDSTAQQLQLMLSLGYRVQEVAPLHRALVEALRASGQLPTEVRRVAFAGALAATTDGLANEIGPRDEAALTATITKVVATLAQGPDRLIAFGAAAAGAELLFAEACCDAGVELHLLLPLAPRRFVAARVARGGRRWVERFYTLMRRIPREKVHVLPQRLAGPGPTRPIERGARWVFDSAAAYGPDRATCLYVAGDGAQAREPDLAAFARASGCPTLRLPIRRAPAPPDPLRPGPTTAPRGRLLAPFGDPVGFRAFLDEQDTPAAALAAARWRELLARAGVQALLRRLDVRLEPIVRLAPRASARPIAFELLALVEGGQSFAEALEAARASGLPASSLKEYLLWLQLRAAVALIRVAVAEGLEPKPHALRLSMNLDGDLLGSPLLGPLLGWLFAHEPEAQRVIFEVSEGLDLSRLPALKDLIKRFRDITLALDDANDAKAQLRKQLARLIDHVKADWQHTSLYLQELRRARRAVPEAMTARPRGRSRIRDLLHELARPRMPDRTFVLEGVEKKGDLGLLTRIWRPEHGTSWAQGYAIKATGWKQYLKPMSGKSSRPCGYRRKRPAS
jgi:EAL domain-containing protein (putative c-di-GMP-specific phosphodiesterase class I)